MIGTDTVDAAEIRRLIPHGGSMCLIEQVVQWDLRTIHCRTRTHLDPAHPLRRDGGLSALHLVEYGAQAMAIHGGLEARSRGATAAPGLLVSVRDLRLEVQQIDDLEGPLELHAEQQLASSSGWLYDFRALCGERLLGSGRIAVMSDNSFR